MALENVLDLNHELQNVPVVIQQSCINRSIVLKNVSVGHMLVVKLQDLSDLNQMCMSTLPSLVPSPCVPPGEKQSSERILGLLLKSGKDQ